MKYKNRISTEGGGTMEQHIKANPSLGHAIRSLRIDCGFGVEELTQSLQLRGYDITRQCLYKIESGNHHVTIELLRLLKEIFDVPYERILDFKEENN